MSFTDEELTRMLDLARTSLLSAFDLVEALVASDWLSRPGACFVTLTRKGDLRGCIGTLEPHRSLGEDLIENARHAAFSDPRFEPVDESELADIDIEISILTPSERIGARSEQELLAQLRPGVDGVIVDEGPYRATFLPSVWEQLPEPDEFIRALRRKAGLPPTSWSDQMRWFRYETQHMKGRLMDKR